MRYFPTLKSGAIRPDLNQNGNSVMFVIISLMVLSGTCIELLTGGVTQMPSVIKNSRISAVRDSIEFGLMNKASSGGLYRSSIHPNVLASNLNTDLRVCILGDVPGAVCEANRAYPVSLVSWETDLKTSSTSLRAIAGPTGAAALYDVKGTLCPASVVASSADCPFEVTATFKATCAGNTATCSTADNFQIQYSIQAPNLATDKVNYLSLKRDRTAVLVSINDVLPLKTGTVTSVVQVKVLQGYNTMPVTARSPIVLALIASGVGKPQTVNLIYDLITALGITDPALITAIAYGSLTDKSSIQKFVSNMTSLNITNPIALNALAGLSDTSAAKLGAIANAITTAGITSQNIANQIANNGVTDPVLAAAYAVPKTAQMLSLINAVSSGSQSSANAIASALYVANITAANPNLVTSLAAARVTSPTLATGIAAAITTANITAPLQMNALATASVTNPVTAAQLSNSITATGTTSQPMANAIALGSMTTTAQAVSFANTMASAGTGINPVNFATTGIVDPAVFGTFVDVIVGAGLASNRSAINNLAKQVLTQNLTTVTDITALATPVATTVASSGSNTSTTTTSSTSGTNVKSAGGNKSVTTTTSTTSSTATTGSTTGTFTPTVLQLVTGTCVSNCGVSAF